MTAITDIQQALNIIRKLERDAAVDTRLATLALITGTAADIARELRGDDQQPKKRAALKPTVVPKPKPPAPKSSPVPKPPTPSKPVSPSAPFQPPRKPKPFTEPER